MEDRYQSALPQPVWPSTIENPSCSRRVWPNYWTNVIKSGLVVSRKGD
jgi:hypothetical protein